MFRAISNNSRSAWTHLVHPLDQTYVLEATIPFRVTSHQLESMENQSRDLFGDKQVGFVYTVSSTRSTTQAPSEQRAAKPTATAESSQKNHVPWFARLFPSPLGIITSPKQQNSEPVASAPAEPEQVQQPVSHASDGDVRLTITQKDVSTVRLALSEPWDGKRREQVEHMIFELLGAAAEGVKYRVLTAAQ